MSGAFTKSDVIINSPDNGRERGGIGIGIGIGIEREYRFYGL